MTPLTSTKLKLDSYDQAFALLRKIAVEPPYFALGNIQLEGDFVIKASFQTELHHPDEISPICTSEVGRHIAILGSLALAKINPVNEKHYYLAKHAIVERTNVLPHPDDIFTGIVTSAELSKKSGDISAELLNSKDEVIYRITVNYSVIHHKLFARLFNNNKQLGINSSSQNPYVENTPFNFLQIGKEICTASLGMVEPYHCQGHFNEYPAMPVARLGNALINLAGKHYREITGSTEKYCIVKAEIKAHSLIFAGDEVELKSEIDSQKYDKGLIINTFAYNKACCLAAELQCYIA